MKEIDKVKTAKIVNKFWQKVKGYQEYLTLEYLTMYRWLIKQLEPQKKKERDLYNHLLKRRDETLTQLSYIREEMEEVNYHDFIHDIEAGDIRLRVKQLKEQYRALDRGFKELDNFYRRNGFKNRFKAPHGFDDELQAVRSLRV